VITLTGHTTFGGTPLDERSTRRRDLSLPDNTQHTQESNIDASGGFQTHNPSTRAAAGPRVRPPLGSAVWHIHPDISVKPAASIATVNLSWFLGAACSSQRRYVTITLHGFVS